MKTIARAQILAIGILGAGIAAAQDNFPSRPVTIVIPYPAGGTSDAQVRMIQDLLGKALGQPVVVENKPGASGAVAAIAVAKSKADGYTLLYPNNGVLIAPLLNDKAGYDALKDFKPVSTVTSVPMVLVTNKKVPVSNLTEFIQYAKQQPASLMYASAGNASYGHLASARLSQMAGIKVDHVPYKGEAGTTLAVRTGEVQMLLTTPSSTMLGQVNQGNLTLLGVASEKPSPVVPGATPINAVVPGFTAEVWFGLLAPAGTPDAVIRKLNAAVQTAVNDRNVRVKLLVSGALPHTSTPQEFAAIMKNETAMWTDVIRKYGIKAD